MQPSRRRGFDTPGTDRADIPDTPGAERGPGGLTPWARKAGAMSMRPGMFWATPGERQAALHREVTEAAEAVLAEGLELTKVELSRRLRVLPDTAQKRLTEARKAGFTELKTIRHLLHPSKPRRAARNSGHASTHRGLARPCPAIAAEVRRENFAGMRDGRHEGDDPRVAGGCFGGERRPKSPLSLAAEVRRLVREWRLVKAGKLPVPAPRERERFGGYPRDYRPHRTHLKYSGVHNDARS